MTLALASQLLPQDPHVLDGGDEGFEIGLVNNMPDAALRSTERQFRTILTDAARGRPYRLTLLFLPERPRAEAGWSHISKNYEDVSKLWSSGRRLDGLIVTGAEPSTPSLEDEPYWRTLVRLIDWAENNTTSTIWLCLAAHAAVRHLDGVERRPFPKKLSGVFACKKAVEHPILDGLPSTWSVPHSRSNDVSEQALVAHGYRILSRSPDVGADLFARHKQSLFLFAQGHPEYDASVLLREYRRDIARYLSGESDNYPDLPQRYFDKQTEALLGELRVLAHVRRDIDVLLSFPATAQITLTQSWQLAALKIYSNWLCFLSERKAQNEAPQTQVNGGHHRAMRSRVPPSRGGHVS
jgi:homoserine O-succinyltransferase/O-acetyltransferase